MLSNKKKTTSSPFDKGGTTLLAQSVEVEGNITFSGTLEVEGRIKGNVYPADSKSAQINIRVTGKVDGEISAPNVMINGEINGDVFASEHLELAANARVTGNVHYTVIEMVKGAQVNGSLVCVEQSKEPKDAKSTTAKNDKSKTDIASKA